METFSTLLALCAGNSSVTGEFPSQRPVTQSSHIFFELRLNKQLSKQLWVWWFEMSSRSLWRHCNEWMASRAQIAMWQKSGLWNSLIFLELDREITKIRNKILWKILPIDNCPQVQLKTKVRNESREKIFFVLFLCADKIPKLQNTIIQLCSHIIRHVEHHFLNYGAPY